MYTIANIRPLGFNVGNNAINFSLRYMLHEVFGRHVTIVDYPATSKHESTAKAGLTPSTVHEINRYADGVIVGGGNLYENDEVEVDPRALSSLQPPLLLFSNSRGKIYDRRGTLSNRSDVIPDSKLSALLDRADISLSRDSATHRYLSVINKKDSLGWCPTINLGRYKDNLPQLPDNEEVGTLISVRTPALMNIPYWFQTRIYNDIEKAIESLYEAGHKRVRILCNDSRDLDFASAFRYTKAVDFVYTSDVYQYLSLLKHATMVVSYRLHATLPAISFGTPVINITYDERAQSLIDDLDISSANLNLVELGADFTDKLKKMIEDGGYTAEAHTTVVSSWNEKSNFQFASLNRFKEMMKQYLNSGSWTK